MALKMGTISFSNVAKNGSSINTKASNKISKFFKLGIERGKIKGDSLRMINNYKILSIKHKN